MSSRNQTMLVAGAAVAAYLGYKYVTKKPDAIDGSSGVTDKSWDVIIVGSGSAGSALAARLSEDPSVRVLLIEAGGENRHWKIECGWQCMDIQQTPWDWTFKTKPQENTKGRVHNWPRGLILGGCSSTNAVLYVRGSPGDYERWEHGLGCTGWGWNEMERCFKKAERFQPASLASSELSHHGRDGGISVFQLSKNTAQKFTTYVVEAFANSGLFKFNPDYNGEDVRGISYSQLTVENGVRCDVFNGYLRRPDAEGKRALDRPNLTVLKNTYVTRVVIDDNKRATGVMVRFASENGGFEGLAKGQEVFFPAAKEVILSAGAVNSPWLLQLSGVGPKDVLERAGVPVKLANEAIGRNMKDHLFVPITWDIEDNSGITAAPTLTMVGRLLQYLAFRAGPLSTGFIESMAFADSGLTDTEPNLKWRPRADIQIHHTPTFSANKSPSAKAVGIEPWIKKAEMYGVTMLPSLLVPRSVGTVEITSSDPSVRPIVDPHYLEHPDDIEILKQAIKMCLKTAEAEPLKSKVKQIHFRPSALETFNNDHTTDEFIEDHIRSNAITIYHPTSSVKMGADEASPLDLRCRVRGIAGLRVVDASSFPDLVSGNTNAPVIAFAERASELILEDLKA